MLQAPPAADEPHAASVEVGVPRSPSVAPERVLRCQRAGCSAPAKGRHGRFCSDACRAAAWKLRQREISFPIPATESLT